VQIYDCNGTLAQQWTYDPTSKALIYAKSPSMCLDARGGGTTAGTAVQIYDCNGTAAQQWTLLYSSDTISNDKSGLFLDAAGGGTANGTLVQLWTGSGSQGQLWSRTSTQGGAVHAVGAGKCLHLPSWNNGTQAVIYHCYDTPLQEWTYHRVAQTFTVNRPSGPKCLDAEALVSPSKAVIAVINDCTGAATQRWSLDYGKKTITNDASGESRLVLDTNGATADGTGLQLNPSVVDDTGQQWVWPLS
jgi:hypothetical protein